jgi:hypothetical protein
MTLLRARDLHVCKNRRFPELRLESEKLIYFPFEFFPTKGCIMHPYMGRVK